MTEIAEFNPLYSYFDQNPYADFKRIREYGECSALFANGIRAYAYPIAVSYTHLTLPTTPYE